MPNLIVLLDSRRACAPPQPVVIVEVRIALGALGARAVARGAVLRELRRSRAAQHELHADRRSSRWPRVGCVAMAGQRSGLAASCGRRRPSITWSLLAVAQRSLASAAGEARPGRDRDPVADGPDDRWRRNVSSHHSRQRLVQLLQVAVPDVTGRLDCRLRSSISLMIGHGFPLAVKSLPRCERCAPPRRSAALFAGRKRVDEHSQRCMPPNSQRGLPCARWTAKFSIESWIGSLSAGSDRRRRTA